MGPVLKGLIQLQSIENRLRAAKAKLARCRRNVIIKENQLRSLQNSLEAKKEEIQLAKIQVDRLELELKARDENIANLRTSLNTVKSNKAYAAVLTQINTTKADNSKIESQVLELMKDVEADEAESKSFQEQIEEQKKGLESTRKETEELSARYQGEIEQIQKEWDEAAEGIPKKALEIFNRIAETYDGEALAVIEKQEGKGGGTYICGGCFMGVPAESVNLLLTKDEIIRCPNCTRILVLGSS